jgi:hypothetical protein
MLGESAHGAGQACRKPPSYLHAALIYSVTVPSATHAHYAENFHQLYIHKIPKYCKVIVLDNNNDRPVRSETHRSVVF